MVEALRLERAQSVNVNVLLVKITQEITDPVWRPGLSRVFTPPSFRAVGG